MTNIPNIPNEYTGCEVYLGYTIATLNGRYSVFHPSGARFPEHYGDRASCRRMIERDKD